MPSPKYWLRDAAISMSIAYIGAIVALVGAATSIAVVGAIVALVGTGYGWYRAALTEQQTAERKAAEKIAAERARRGTIIWVLTRFYIRSYDNISSAIVAGTEKPPAEWLNRQLQEMGESWRVGP